MFNTAEEYICLIRFERINVFTRSQQSSKHCVFLFEILIFILRLRVFQRRLHYYVRQTMVFVRNLFDVYNKCIVYNNLFVRTRISAAWQDHHSVNRTNVDIRCEIL